MENNQVSEEAVTMSGVQHCKHVKLYECCFELIKGCVSVNLVKKVMVHSS